MDYNFKEDLKSIREILELSQSEMAEKIGVEQVTLSRSELGKTKPSSKLLEKVYSFAFENNVKINTLNEMLWKESVKDKQILLFHGAKDEIVGKLKTTVGRKNNDCGQGFYAGESYHQAISYVSNYDSSSVYFLVFEPRNLKCKKYDVDQDWMLTIASYRGVLGDYENHPMVKRLVEKSKECDYIIAPIADNRMFRIIDSFVSGEITDEQCVHCLSATNLGYQYVFTNKKALDKAMIVERCYLSKSEKDYYISSKGQENKIGEDKVKLARRKYRGKGKYIDEILK